ncbi:MAG: MBL fold metallo-hydrolase [Gemmatimonadales bacterium]
MTGAASTIRYDHPVRLSALVRRLTQPNPGPFTGPGTNTFLVGARSLVILEPGEARNDDHLERIVAAAAGSRVLAVIPSHGHEDHWTLAPALADRLGVPIWFHGAHPVLPVDRSLEDGDEIALDGARLDVIHTPGHTPEHLSFVLRDEGALFPGDHVMGWSSSIIAPPEGNLREYLRSLERLAAIPGLTVAHPAHGESIPDPYARIEELATHRRRRTVQLLTALERGSGTVAELVRQVYTDVEPSLHPAAALSLRAHLVALELEGRVTADRRGDADDWESEVWALTA